MRFLFLFFELFLCVSLCAQNTKPAIDTSEFRNWPFVDGGAVSNDGNYILYIHHSSFNSLIVRSLKGAWETKIDNAKDATFSTNSRFVIFQTGDSLCLLELGNNLEHWLPFVDSYQIVKEYNAEFLIYTSFNSKRTLTIKNLWTDFEKSFYRVKAISNFNDGKSIFVNMLSESASLPGQELGMLNFKDYTITPIWTSKDTGILVNLNSIAESHERGKIAFEVTDNHKKKILCYNERLNRTVLLADDSSVNSDIGLEIGDICAPGFSYDGNRIFITVQSKKLPVRTFLPGVDIWNYKDEKLQSQQLYEIRQSNLTDNPEVFTAVIEIDSSRTSRLTFENESIVILKGLGDSIGVITNWGRGLVDERNWNPTSKYSFYLISTKSKQRRKFSFCFEGVSSTGRYLYGYDSLYRFIYLYDLTSRLIYNISASVPKYCQLDEDYDKPGNKRTGLSIAGWMTNDSAVVFYDKYDIWALDPLHKKQAVNVTMNYGRLNKIEFRLIGNFFQNGYIENSHAYVLSAFNEQSKANGFFSICFYGHSKPKLLSMGYYRYTMTNDVVLESNYLAGDYRSVYMIKRESAAQSPNYFVTRDFEKFIPVSCVYPEESYNWLTSKVIHWQGEDSKMLDGVLYAPQNFNSTKKYPVIINVYEKLSQNANEYVKPDYCYDNINIPWFVSRGYIVVTPDISYKIGFPGFSAYKSIIGVTKYLCKYYPWIDSKRIALQGHSWGGYEVNYMATHSNLYCAIASASSISDLISDYGSLMESGGSRGFVYELDQGRIGSPPWKRKDLYLKNSPVLYANRVTSPLLLMSDKADPTVPFDQGVELFTALRRLKKKVWLLQYDGQGHSLFGHAAIDYTERLTQFFDHYCLNASSPIWMTKGVPARLKGVDYGFELDSSDLRLQN